MTGAIHFSEVKEGSAIRLFRNALSPLQNYLDDPDTQEVMINSPGDVWVERLGVMSQVQEGAGVTAESIRVASKALASINDKDLIKVLDCRMPGFRIAAVTSPIAIHGPSICIRKHSRTVMSLDDYLAADSFSMAEPDADLGRHDAGGEVPDGCPIPVSEIEKGGQALREFFVWMVESYKNFLVAGSTGSGKTTFINALLGAVPAKDRVVTIEDTAELNVTVPNRVCFEANDVFGVSIRHLVKLALRYRPDRILVGEVRGPESYDLLDALNTGHSGGGASIHANSAKDALLRLENLTRMSPESANMPLSALRQQIASTIHYVVFCSRRGGKRGPRRVIRLDGIDASGNYLVTPVFGGPILGSIS